MTNCFSENMVELASASFSTVKYKSTSLKQNTLLGYSLRERIS